MNFLVDLFKLSFSDPKAAGLRIVKVEANLLTSFKVLVLVSIGIAISSSFFNGFKPIELVPAEVFQDAWPVSPVLHAFIIICRTIGLILCILMVGRAFGSSGTFTDGLMILSWSFVLQTIILTFAEAILILLPFQLVGIGMLFVIFVWVWVLIGLTNVWLGLNNSYKSAGCLVIGCISFSVVIGVILTLFGVTMGSAPL